MNLSGALAEVVVDLLGAVSCSSPDPTSRVDRRVGVHPDMDEAVREASTAADQREDRKPHLLREVARFVRDAAVTDPRHWH